MNFLTVVTFRREHIECRVFVLKITPEYLNESRASQILALLTRRNAMTVNGKFKENSSYLPIFYLYVPFKRTAKRSQSINVFQHFNYQFIA